MRTRTGVVIAHVLPIEKARRAAAAVLGSCWPLLMAAALCGGAAACGAGGPAADPLERHLEMAFEGNPESSAVQILAARQRELFERLTRDDASAAELMMLSFSIVDDAAVRPAGPQTELARRQPGFPLFTNLTRRFEPGTLPMDEMEVRTTSDRTAYVVAYADGLRPSITTWELKKDGWKARGLRVNASEETMRTHYERTGTGRGPAAR